MRAHGDGSAPPMPTVRLDPPPTLPAARRGGWDWQLHGTCREHPMEVFFPEHRRGPLRDTAEREAKDICRVCPVISECRRFALTVPEKWGIWGAMTPRERHRIRSGRASGGGADGAAQR